jgi:hypothetical protein
MIVNPAGEPRVQHHQIAPRPESLHGLRLGFLDNGKANADLLLKEIGRLIDAQVDLQSTVYVKRRSTFINSVDTRRADEEGYDEVLKRLVRECDVVVSGVGD